MDKNVDKSTLYKPILDKLDLTKFDIIDPVTDKSNLVDVAKSLGYKPKDLDLTSPKEKAQAIQSDLGTAKSYGELDGKLSANDLWLEKKGEQIVFTDGYSDVKASSIDSNFKLNNFEKKFGEDVSKYLEARNKGIDFKEAESRVQGVFNSEIVEELKSERRDVKSEISEIRYELASIQTAPAQSKNIDKKNSLILQKSNLLKKHQNLSTEIASLEKTSRLSTSIDSIKLRAAKVKNAAQNIGGSVKSAKKGYNINKKSIEGMNSARKVIGFQKSFKKLLKDGKNKLKEGIKKIPEKLASLDAKTTATAKPILKVSHTVYRGLEKIANDPELHR